MVLVIDCCVLLVALGVVVAPEMVLVPDVEPDAVLPGMALDCVPDDVVPVCAPVVDVSGCAIGGVATVSAVLVVPDWVLVLVPGVVVVVELPAPRLPEAVPEAEPLSVLELVLVPLFELSVVPPWLDWDVELDGDGNVTVDDELPPELPPDELLPMLDPDLVEVDGVDDDCVVWLEPDCACNASVAANNATVLVLTNFRGIFIMT